jgi:crotonobetainyl-CoA:carnitine CoA-transferase CaiB-like acyl-CoA transferase
VSGPLDGVRVVDLSTVVMGPWTTHILAGYGADVVKVEPLEGDVMRNAGVARNPGMGSLFLFMNRGKRSVALDLKRPDARDALLRVCASADVFVHNIRPAAMARLGLGYEDVAGTSPRIVYVSLVGYGQNGPYAAKPAYDDLVQGISGMASLFHAVDGGEPRYVPALVADRVTGVNAAHAILAALFHRERTGIGQSIEVPMFETMAELVLSDHLGGHIFEPPAGDFGYNRVLTPNRRPFRTADGYVCILLYTERQWQRFFDVVGERARFEADPRLCDPAVRRLDYDNAYGAVAALVETRATQFWLASLGAADIPVVPLYDVADLPGDPHLLESGFWHDEEHPTEGRLRSTRTPARWSACENRFERPAPRLGEHTREVLREAGLTADSIDALAR